MSIDKSIYVPLFSPISALMDSAFFHVHPGDVVMLQGFGFQDFKSRADKTELQVEQAACLQMLLFSEDVLEQEPSDCRIFDINKYQTSLIEKDTLRVNGCAIGISKNHNILFLDIPGSYCFTMNDGTALGNARVYLRTYSKTETPWKSKLFIGER